MLTRSPVELRIARRIELARQELEMAGGSSVTALEILGSAVADWTLNASRTFHLLTSEHETPSTSKQLEALDDHRVINHDRFVVLQTAYQSRNLAHHEQLGLEKAQSLMLLDAVRWATQEDLAWAAGVESTVCPVTEDDLLSISASTKRVRREGVGTKRPRHLDVVLNLSIENTFDPEFGPANFTAGERSEIVRAVARRGMLSGVIRNQRWPLISCDICEAIVPIDLCGTPQEECMSYCDARLEAFCAFGCGKAHQKAVRDLMKRNPSSHAYDQYYYLQNTVEMVTMNEGYTRKSDDS
jgi:hypothetical protein